MTAATIRTSRMLAALLSTEAVAGLVDAVADPTVRDLYGKLLARLVEVREAAKQAAKVAT
jgi:hypothetical protein